jgi:glucose-6-phosphate 1-epimerase
MLLQTMAMWPNKFQALYKVTLMDDKLNCEMTVKNTDTKSWDFQAALHTYFHVNNIDKCEVQGDFMGSPHLNRMAKPPGLSRVWVRVCVCVSKCVCECV